MSAHSVTDNLLRFPSCSILLYYSTATRYSMRQCRMRKYAPDEIRLKIPLRLEEHSPPTLPRYPYPCVHRCYALAVAQQGVEIHLEDLWRGIY